MQLSGFTLITANASLILIDLMLPAHLQILELKKTLAAFKQPVLKIMRHLGVEPRSQEPESCVLSITLAAQHVLYCTVSFWFWQD